MDEAVAQTALAGRVVNFPSPWNRELLSVRELADAYMSIYTGRDNNRPARIRWWCDRIGAARVIDLDADLIADHLDAYAAAPREKYMGRDAHGQPKLKALGPRKPATVNRMKSTLGALLSFARQRRLTPRGWLNPIRDVPGRREDNARTRFLSPEEQVHLLNVARICSWPGLHTALRRRAQDQARLDVQCRNKARKDLAQLHRSLKQLGSALTRLVARGGARTVACGV